MADAILLQLRVRAGRAEARINDIPVTRVDEEEILNVSVPPQPYLIDGENTLKLYAAPFDPDRPGAFEARARIAGFSFGDFANFDSGETWSDIQWSPEMAGRPVGQRFAYETPHRWQWQDAPELTLDDELRGRLDAYVGDLHAAFAQRDAQALVAAREVVFEEGQRAFAPPLIPPSPDEFAQGLAERDEETWRVEPFLPQRGNYRLVAKRRLVELIGPFGHPLLRQAPAPDVPPDLLMTMPVKVGLVDGELKALR